jgi:predicted GIY-YIG superfamily endonuclease
LTVFIYMKKIYIYCLKDGNDIRYVGKTTNLKRRLSAHISEAKRLKGRRYVLNWIFNLLLNDKKPTIHCIEECDENSWQEKERYWISFYRNLIPNLCNNCDGGLGGSGSKNYTEDELDKIRIRMRTLHSKFSEEEKLSIWNLIKLGYDLKTIKLQYPKYTRHMDFGIRTGREWNHITGLLKTKGTPRRKGYTYNKGFYLIKDKNKKIIHSSKNENDILKLLKIDY